MRVEVTIEGATVKFRTPNLKKILRRIEREMSEKFDEIESDVTDIRGFMDNVRGDLQNLADQISALKDQIAGGLTPEQADAVVADLESVRATAQALADVVPDEPVA